MCVCQFLFEFQCHQPRTFRRLKKMIFWECCPEKATNPFFLGKIPIYYVATYVSFNLRHFPANLVHFQEI